MKCAISECDKEAVIESAEFLWTGSDSKCNCHLYLCFAHRDWWQWVFKMYEAGVVMHGVHGGTYEEIEFDPEKGVIHGGVHKRMFEP